MNKKKPQQYTLRGIPERTDSLLREKALKYGTSLNETAIKALQQGLGQVGTVLHHDFDKFAGTWVQEGEVDRALEEFEKIDEGLWK